MVVNQTPFNIRLNSHKKDIKNPSAIISCKHFNKHDHDFNNDEEQLRNVTTTSTEKSKERLK